MQGDTPLHAAAQHAGPPLLKMLLDSGCNPLAENLLVIQTIAKVCPGMPKSVLGSNLLPKLVLGSEPLPKSVLGSELLSKFVLASELLPKSSIASTLAAV